MVNNMGIGFAVSTSMALVATSAMASVKSDVVEAPSDFVVSSEVSAKIDAALAKKDVKDAVNNVFGAIVSRFGNDGEVLAKRYFPEGSQVAYGWGSNDSTDLGPGDVGCYSNCHNNCHSNCHGACHGARGWR